MTLGMVFRVAWRALWRNRMRTLLTMLGIIIGVAAVIAMLAIGNGARESVQSSISGLGSNVITVYPGSSRRPGSRGVGTSRVELTLDDLVAVRALSGVAAASPVLRGDAQVVSPGASWRSSFHGVSPEFVQIRNWPVASGRMFGEAEVDASANVALLGQVTAQSLFGATDPVGETVRVRGVPCRVIGVLGEKGQQAWGASGDDLVVVPYTTAMRKLIGTDRIQGLLVSARRPDRMESTQEAILKLLVDRHRVPEAEAEDAFYAYNQAEISRSLGESTRVFTLLLGSIASVSLLVGGIGIMNIMLVSVTERIREIGIRMAVGARGRDVLIQFLIEAVVLSVLGGLIGIALGVGVSLAIARLAGWPSVISQGSVLLAFGFSALVGIFFGFYPALQASRLDPIQALRHE